MEFAGPASSPTNASGQGAGSRTLDSAPPMPPRQRRSGSVLFTPPMDDAGMNAMGGDPLVQTMAMTKQVETSFQKLAMLYPELVDPLAQLQQSFRQLITGLLSTQAESMNAPNIVPPLPMEGGSTAGVQQGATL